MKHVVPEFTGDGSHSHNSRTGVSVAEALRGSRPFATEHGIPESHWPNAVSIELREKAKSWYENTFQADTF